MSHIPGVSRRGRRRRRRRRRRRGRKEEEEEEEEKEDVSVQVTAKHCCYEHYTKTKLLCKRVLNYWVLASQPSWTSCY